MKAQGIDGSTETTFGAVVENVSINHKKLPKSHYASSGQFPVVDQGQDFIGGYSDDQSKVVTSDLPLLVFGDHTRVFKYLDRPFIPGADGIKVLKPVGVNPKWLFHAAHSLDFPDKGYARHYQHLKAARLVVPPIEAQPGIVAEIEKQFTRLESGVAALRRVQANLKRYRAAVLKAACEGRLVPTEAELAKTGNRDKKFETGEALLTRILTEGRKNWQGPGKYKEPSSSTTASLPRLADGWAYCPMELLADVIDPQPSHRTPSEKADGVPYIGIGDVRSDGTVDFLNARKVSAEVFGEHQQRYRLRDGDFIVGKIGTVGKAVRLPMPFAYTLSANVVLIQPNPMSTNRSFLQILLESPESQKQFSKGSQATTQAAFGIKKFRQLPVALPPFAEQTRIVAEVERRLSVADELETVVTANLQRATRLRQSILNKAFTGNLM